MKRTIVYIVLLSIVSFIGCQVENKENGNSINQTVEISDIVDTNQTSDANQTLDTNISFQENEYTPLGKQIEYADTYHLSRTTPSAFPEIGTSQDPRYNDEAPITPMCYTKHETHYNPCYVCHQNAIWENGINVLANAMNDKGLQNEYAFSDIGVTNRWINLFWDKSNEVSQISDEEILLYTKTENYTALRTLLLEHNFSGYVPDLSNLHLAQDAFESDGFAKDNSGWVAFNYKPLPSTFWPVNGSTDDVMIRLAKKFRQTTEGNYSKTAYKFNLAILEAAMKNLSTISVPELDERIIGTDLNGDGNLSVVSTILRPTHYVGAAASSAVHVGLYPRYTEFLHSVRYIGLEDNDTIYNAPHMKELRYMIKVDSYDQAQVPYTWTILAGLYDDELMDKEQGNLPRYPGLGEKGVDNKHGWWLQAFIEDSSGNLRPQTYEETFFCMGCHTTVGTTADKTFAFARKVDGKDGWGYIDLKKMIDVPNKGEAQGEILTYFKRVGGGNEFRAYNDINERFFDNDEVNVTKVLNTTSIYELITPSREKALQMSKAYQVIVKDQNFIKGRDGNSLPFENVYRLVDDTTPTLAPSKQYTWDIRLDWSSQLEP